MTNEEIYMLIGIFGLMFHLYIILGILTIHIYFKPLNMKIAHIPISLLLSYMFIGWSYGAGNSFCIGFITTSGLAVVFYIYLQKDSKNNTTRELTKSKTHLRGDT